MADETKNPPAEPKNATTVQKATTAAKATTTEEPVSGDFPAEGQTISEDGTFNGETRYEGTVLVERKVGEDWVTVMTDKPRPGDKVQAHTLNPRTGELETSQESSDPAGSARMPGKS